MGKLAAIGAVILGFNGAAGVTSAQATRALVQDAKALPTSQITCTPSGRAQDCQVIDTTTSTSDVLGPETIVGTTVFRVSRGRHGYRVRVLVPDHFDIYARPSS